jgi:hypothetical protein
MKPHFFIGYPEIKGIDQNLSSLEPGIPVSGNPDRERGAPDGQGWIGVNGGLAWTSSWMRFVGIWNQPGSLPGKWKRILTIRKNNWNFKC